MASTVVRGGVGAVGSLFGMLDKPTSLQASEVCTVRTAREWQLSDGLDTSVVMSRQPERPAFQIPVNTGGTDEMLLSTLAGVPGIISRFTYTTATAPGTELATIPVNPRAWWSDERDVNGTLSFVATHACAATWPFRFWRGSSVFKIYWTASPFHSARFRISFQPMVNALSYVSPEDLVTEVIDVNGPGACDFVVPFQYCAAFAERSIGVVCIQAVNPPPPIGEVVGAPITFTVYACCPDLEVAEAVSNYLIPTEMFKPIPFETEPGLVKPQWEPREEMASGVGTMVDPFPHFSQKYTTIGDVVKCAIPFVQTSPVVAPTILCLPQLFPQSLTTLHNPGVRVWIGPDATGLPTEGVTASGQIDYGTTVGCPVLGAPEHFANCYKYQRGSVRHKVTPTAGLHGDAVSGMGDRVRIRSTMVTSSSVYESEWTVSVVYYPIGATTAPSSFIWNDIMEQSAVDGMLESTSGEFEIPHHSIRPWVTTGMPYSASSSPFFDAVKSGQSWAVTHNQEFGSCNYSTTPSATSSHIVRAMGDDWVLSYINWPSVVTPYYVRTTVPTSGIEAARAVYLQGFISAYVDVGALRTSEQRVMRVMGS